MKVIISKCDYLPSGTYELIETTGKLAQAIKNVGFGASPRQVLIEHDHRGGLIRDESGKSVPVGTFWNIEKVKIDKRKIQAEKYEQVKKSIAPVVQWLVIPLFLAYLIYRFGWN